MSTTKINLKKKKNQVECEHNSGQMWFEIFDLKMSITIRSSWFPSAPSIAGHSSCQLEIGMFLPRAFLYFDRNESERGEESLAADAATAAPAECMQIRDRNRISAIPDEQHFWLSFSTISTQSERFLLGSFVAQGNPTSRISILKLTINNQLIRSIWSIN